MSDTGEQKQVKRAKSRWQLKQQQEEEELKAVVDTYAGRAVIWRILCSCGLYEAASGDMQEAYRQAGRRDVGLEFIQALDGIAPNAYSTMRDEAISRDINHKVEDKPEKEEFNG